MPLMLKTWGTRQWRRGGIESDITHSSTDLKSFQITFFLTVRFPFFPTGFANLKPLVEVEDCLADSPQREDRFLELGCTLTILTTQSIGFVMICLESESPPSGQRGYEVGHTIGQKMFYPWKRTTSSCLSNSEVVSGAVLCNNDSSTYHGVSSEVFRFQSTWQKLLSLGLGCLGPALRRALLFLDRGCVACSPGSKKSSSIWMYLDLVLAQDEQKEVDRSVLSSFPNCLNDCPILASEILSWLLGVSITSLSLML